MSFFSLHLTNDFVSGMEDEILDGEKRRRFE